MTKISNWKYRFNYRSCKLFKTLDHLKNKLELKYLNYLTNILKLNFFKLMLKIIQENGTIIYLKKFILTTVLLHAFYLLPCVSIVDNKLDP